MYSSRLILIVVTGPWDLPPHIQASDDKIAQPPPCTLQQTAHHPRQKQTDASIPSNAPYIKYFSTLAHFQTFCTPDRQNGPLLMAESTGQLIKLLPSLFGPSMGRFSRSGYSLFDGRIYRKALNLAQLQTFKAVNRAMAPLRFRKRYGASHTKKSSVRPVIINVAR